MFTRNQYAALFHDVGGKTPSIGCRQHGIQTRVIQYRRTGFFIGLLPRGQGARAAEAGETRLGGRIPISTSGGLTSRGHPAYVTSLYNYVELAEQLRGRAGARQVEGARLGLATGELGNYNAALIHVLEAQR